MTEGSQYVERRQCCIGFALSEVLSAEQRPDGGERAPHFNVWLASEASKSARGRPLMDRDYSPWGFHGGASLRREEERGERRPPQHLGLLIVLHHKIIPVSLFYFAGPFPS